MKLFFTSNAIRRLTQIEDYERSKGNDKKARQTVKGIRDTAKKLEKYPEIGPVEEQLGDLGQGHRSILFGTLYKIIYLLAQPLIIVTDIFDVRQDPGNMKP
ncbi:type II toxin-antitoxin system RelE/ParE family toxin [Neolewinella lacunae]|uniref:Type II toxin-antitoxin system RelE/ParE family toxin n=1 Tax=Neolewinella lacunae TaxID=1517758 RepID=A0A923T9R9_9BACT|nr:type II toxin-antitoxin system RelE/ParE family toxin [Neolewinella lacunae]MBC6995829.1 type II toxin-antitoxin system RelE/ParE family toxin [Neolewinella lacunae]MDN3636478.1 type II toxin-antitoxin system RelE/ParE family toxin [Neolewinella lacunae]